VVIANKLLALPSIKVDPGKSYLSFDGTPMECARCSENAALQSSKICNIIGEVRMATNPRQAEKNSREQETFRGATDAGFETTRRTAEQGAQTMADAGRQATTATAEVVRRNADLWRAGSEIGGRMAQRSMEQFSRLFSLAGGDTQNRVQRSFNNVQAIVESSTNIADGLRSASTEWMAFAQKNIEHNFDRMNALMQWRSIDECIVVQTEFARDNLEGFLQSVQRMSEIAAQAAEEAGRRINQASLAPK